MNKYTPKKNKLREDILTLVNTWIKFRDNRTCQKTKQKVSGNNCHPSHIIPQSADKRLALEPRNIKVLSYHSHINWRHKNPTESGKRYRETFPQNMQRLEKKHLENQWRWSISLFEYEEFTKQAIELIDSHKRKESKQINANKKNSIRLARNRLLKFLEHMK